MGDIGVRQVRFEVLPAEPARSLPSERVEPSERVGSSELRAPVPDPDATESPRTAPRTQPARA